ncbi:MAG TPA: hypothetical protein VEB42_13155 [Chitinophagaceae bacterium]|nr:hypothetical protein [Chitinophagaceae bacterium]
MDEKKQDQPASQPDPETLHTTDPEEHMKGPFSSAMQGIRKTAEGNDHPQNQERSAEDRSSEGRNDNTDRAPEDNG